MIGVDEGVHGGSVHEHGLEDFVVEEPEDGKPGDECEEGVDGEADDGREGVVASADGADVVVERKGPP